EADLIKYLKDNSSSAEYLYFGALASNPPNSIPIILQYFPHIIQEQNYYGGTTWLFSKSQEKTPDQLSILDFSKPFPENWHSINPEQIITDSIQSGDSYYHMDTLTEWSPTFSIPVKDIITNQNNVIDMAVDFSTISDLSEVILAATLEVNGEVLYFSSADLKLYLQNTNPLNGWATAHHTIKLSDINLNYNKVWLKFFIWNKGKDDFLIDNFRISVREGNPIVYSLYEKIP
ncbi:MAG TPA: hypothetical protein VFD91_10160, partial [Mariniphaga sp.]|nr:hypothetical protein [Mariniphaga sp.]